MGPHLYDLHAARLFALALRITGDEASAADAVRHAFVSLGELADEASLVRATRDFALSGGGAARVAGSESPTPRQLIEAVFYGGQSISDLSQTFALPEGTVRLMLRDGMVQLRRQFAETT